MKEVTIHLSQSDICGIMFALGFLSATVIYVAAYYGNKK
jgi:hypothetical protein